MVYVLDFFFRYVYYLTSMSIQRKLKVALTLIDSACENLSKTSNCITWNL